MSDEIVSVAFPTIMDGTVVRWYHGSYERGKEICSASRNGVTFTHGPPLEVAQQVHELLRADPNADVSAFVTHRVRFGHNHAEPRLSEEGKQ